MDELRFPTGPGFVAPLAGEVYMFSTLQLKGPPALPEEATCD